MATGIFPTRLLRANGLRKGDVRRALAAGVLVRLRRGWYATSTAAPEVVTAVRVGGRLTCLAALRIRGAWTLEAPELHVRIADGISLVSIPRTRVHWTPDRVGPGIDSIEEALVSALGAPISGTSSSWSIRS